MNKNKKLVLAFSGGIDSSVLLHMAAKQFDEIHTVSFDYGQRHKRELECIQKQIAAIESTNTSITITNKILDVSYLKDISPTSSLTNTDIDNPIIGQIAGDAQPVSYVPFRNQMFITICCAYAESLKADTVWYGAAQVDSLAGYWDTTESFIEIFNALVAQNRTNMIKLEAPLLTMSKKDIVQQGINLGIKFEDTWTCYSNHPSGLADITTPSSSLRVQGFINAGYRDPIKYIQQDKLERLYDQKRCKSIN